MLVLSRKEDESIILSTKEGVTIEIKVVDLQSPHKCRIGIEAPKDIVIIRKELINDAKGNKTK